MARTVLIVEDGNNVAPLEIALASLDGITVTVVSNGRDALKFLCDAPGDIAAVITDLHLPYVDGFEIVAALRSDERYSRLPIVVVTGDSHPDTAARIRRLGADAYFQKPYSPAEILRTLEALLHVP